MSTAPHVVPENSEEQTVWVNIYGLGVCGQILESKQAADRFRAEKCIACVPITFKPGDGLK